MAADGGKRTGEFLIIAYVRVRRINVHCTELRLSKIEEAGKSRLDRSAVIFIIGEFTAGT